MNNLRRLEIHWLLVHRSKVIIGNIIEGVILGASCSWESVIFHRGVEMLRGKTGLISIYLDEIGLLGGGGMAAILVDFLRERLGTIVVERHLGREDARLRVVIGLLGMERISKRLRFKREIVVIKIFSKEILLFFKSSWLVLESLIEKFSIDVLVSFFLLVVF